MYTGGFTFEVQNLYEAEICMEDDKMGCCYPHLSLEERRKIAKWREAKMPVPEIADRLGRAPALSGCLALSATIRQHGFQAARSAAWRAQRLNASDLA